MQLTRQTDYGLRMLIYLAVHQDQRVIASVIADTFSVPHNHLMKVIQRLAAAGIIRTHRGRGGGIGLARSPESVGVGEVIRILEKELDPINCKQPACPIAPACALKEVLVNARDAFLATLDDYTLGDIVGKRKHGLSKILSLPQ